MTTLRPAFNPNDINYDMLIGMATNPQSRKFYQELVTLRGVLDDTLPKWAHNYQMAHILWDEVYPMIINEWNDYVLEWNKDASVVQLEFYIPDIYCDGGPMNNQIHNTKRSRQPGFNRASVVKFLIPPSGPPPATAWHPSYPPAPPRTPMSSAGGGGGGSTPTSPPTGSGGVTGSPTSPITTSSGSRAASAIPRGATPTPGSAPAPVATPVAAPVTTNVTSYMDAAGEGARQTAFQQRVAMSGSLYDKDSDGFVDDPADVQLHFLYSGIDKKKPMEEDFFLVTSIVPHTEFNVTDLAACQSDLYVITDITAGRVGVQYIKTMGVGVRSANARTFNFLATTPNYVLAIRRNSDFEISVLRDHPTARKSKVAAEPTVSKRKSYHDPLDGKIIMQNELANITERVRGSAVCRRMTEEKLMRHVISNDVDFNASEAWARLKVLGNSHTMVQIPGSMAVLAADNTERWTRLMYLPVAKDQSVYENVMKGLWTGSDKTDWTTVSLQKFCRDNMCASPEDNFRNKSLIRDALENWEHFLVFCHGMTYDNVTLGIREAIVKGAFRIDTWDAGYVRFLCEVAIADVYHVLKNTPKDEHMLRFSGDISSAAGVRMMMDERFNSVKPTLEIQTQWQDTSHALITGGPTPVRMWAWEKQRNRKRDEPSAKPPEPRAILKKPKVEKVASTPNSSDGAAEAKQDDRVIGYSRKVCATYMLHLWKAMRNGKRTDACTYGSSCKLWHPIHLKNHGKSALNKFVKLHEVDFGKRLEDAWAAVANLQ